MRSPWIPQHLKSIFSLSCVAFAFLFLTSAAQADVGTMGSNGEIPYIDITVNHDMIREQSW
jgi:hypothetical protein